jgi:hypothetical protein
MLVKKRITVACRRNATDQSMQEQTVQLNICILIRVSFARLTFGAISIGVKAADEVINR